MNTKQIILTSAVLGFALPSVVAIGALAISSKKVALKAEGSSVHTAQKDSARLAGCSCPFCQSVRYESKGTS